MLTVRAEQLFRKISVLCARCAHTQCTVVHGKNDYYYNGARKRAEKNPISCSSVFDFFFFFKKSNGHRLDVTATARRRRPVILYNFFIVRTKSSATRRTCAISVGTARAESAFTIRFSSPFCSGNTTTCHAIASRARETR